MPGRELQPVDSWNKSRNDDHQRYVAVNCPGSCLYWNANHSRRVDREGNDIYHHLYFRAELVEHARKMLMLIDGGLIEAEEVQS